MIDKEYRFTVVGYEITTGKTYAYSIHTTKMSAMNSIAGHQKSKPPAAYWIEEH